MEKKFTVLVMTQKSQAYQQHFVDKTERTIYTNKFILTDVFITRVVFSPNYSKFRSKALFNVSKNTLYLAFFGYLLEINVDCHKGRCVCTICRYIKHHFVKSYEYAIVRNHTYN